MRHRSLAFTIVSMAAAIALVSPQLAGSAPSQDPRAERERVRAERAEVAAEIDTSKASRREIDEALQTLQANLQTQEAALARTEAEVAQAEQDIVDAQGAITTLESELLVLRQVMRDRAVTAYVSPPGDDILTVLQTNDFTTAANRKFYLELRAQDDADVADRLEGANVDLAYQKRKATAAKKRAETKRAEQAKRTESVREAKASEQAVADRLSATINDQVARSVALAKTDRVLSARIAEEQAALAAMLAAREEAARAAAAAATTAAAASAPAVQAPTPEPSNQDPDGDENAPLPPTPPPSSSAPPSGSAAVPLCTAGGITVNCAISGALSSLLKAARASGLSLSGGGYRNPAAQIALRRAHCGTSYFAIYEMSPSQCRPPTARPGQSQHELGLAVDFNACQTKSTACYRWLAANAASFGFYNLPGEPWHWSSTGA